MKRLVLALLACVLAFAGNLSAQEEGSASKVLDAVKSEAITQTTDTEIRDALESSSDVSAEQVAADIQQAAQEALEVASQDAAAVEVEQVQVAQVIEAIDAQANEVMESEDETEESDGQEEELEDDGPLFVSVNQSGQLIGLATAIVGGQAVPVEASVSLVRDGVLISKIVAEEDGSFAFPNVAPGDYDMYGVASSYCGQQPFTVLPESNCTTCHGSCPLELSQGGSCYRNLGGAPAASFSSGSLGGVGGGFFGGGGGGLAGGGGGFAGGGGGGALAGRGLRLLGIGGIATAIAVGSSDGGDASPTE